MPAEPGIHVGRRRGGLALTRSGVAPWPGGQGVNSFQLPSEITSTAPSTTVIAVSSSIA